MQPIVITNKLTEVTLSARKHLYIIFLTAQTGWIFLISDPRVSQRGDDLTDTIIGTVITDDQLEILPGLGEDRDQGVSNEGRLVRRHQYTDQRITRVVGPGPPKNKAEPAPFAHQFIHVQADPVGQEPDLAIIVEPSKATDIPIEPLGRGLNPWLSSGLCHGVTRFGSLKPREVLTEVRQLQGDASAADEGRPAGAEHSMCFGLT